MQVDSSSALREDNRILHILLLQDNLVDPKAIIGMLKKTGYFVEAVENQRDALAALEHGNFDIVLIDIEQPEMDAIEATAAIREREKVTGAHLPIIGVVNHALREERGRSGQPGMDASISKPIQLEELLQMIERLMKSTPEDSCQSVRLGQQTLKQEGAFGTVAHQPRLTPTVEDAALTESLKLLAEIQAAIGAGDVTAIRHTADSLKGPITSVLAKEAFEAAYTLEQTLHEDDLARAQDACRRLRAAVTSLNPIDAGKTDD
jgi:two-component system, sensor histidine kinase and response regulator